MRDRVEEAFQVGIHHPGEPGPQKPIDPPQGVLAPTPRTEPVAVFGKPCFPDRFQREAQGRLDDPVAHRRDTQRSLLGAARLVDPRPQDRQRFVGALPQLSIESLQVLFSTPLEHLHAFGVDAGGPRVGLDSRPGSPQGRKRVHLINQAEPFASFHPLFEGGQHAFRPDRRFGPCPAGTARSRLFSGGFCHRHCRGFGVRRPSHHASTFLHPFAPRALPRFYATMDALSSARLTLAGPLTPDRDHGFMHRAVPSFCLHPPGVPGHRFRTFSRVHRDRLPCGPLWGPTGIGASPLPSRLAATTQPYRVRHYPTDRRFTSGCSPPHLAVTQLPSVTGRRTSTWRGLAPLGPDTLSVALGPVCRTGPGAQEGPARQAGPTSVQAQTLGTRIEIFL